MMKKVKLNNMLSFNEHSSLDKLNNKPGKVLESSEITAMERIMGHPIRKKVFESLSDDKDKSQKYVNFWRKTDIGIPKWDEEKSNFIDITKK